MKKNVNVMHIISIFVILVFIIGSMVSASTTDIYTGKGKPKAVEIYVNDIPYGASLGGEVQSGTGVKNVNDFRAIVDDEDHPDPTYYEQASNPVVTGPTPTQTPIPIATTVIPIDKGGVGSTLCVTDATTNVSVDFAFSDAGYSNVFALSSPKSIPLGESKTSQKGTGTLHWDLGKFPVGTELKFSDTANGKTYYTGSYSRNPDKLVHAAITLKNATGTYYKYLVTFEDWYGESGSDFDFNDVEFYVSGDVSTKCYDTSTGEGSLIPQNDDVCMCNKSYNYNNKRTCIALFSYRNMADLEYDISIKDQSNPNKNSPPPWNEFTGSGLVKWNRCQPTKFYVTESENSPFWTNRFWGNIKWMLNYDKSVLVKCEASTRDCTSIEMPNCSACTGT